MQRSENSVAAVRVLPVQEVCNAIRPILYPDVYDIYKVGQRSLWNVDEVDFNEFVLDWETTLTEREKSFIQKVLKGFTTTELLVLDHWKEIGRYYPRPEIIMTAALHSYVETVHAVAYNQIEDVLGIDTYEAFMADEVAQERFNNIWTNLRGGSLKQTAVFSFVEGISLFSSFLLLLAFTYRKNLLRPIKKVIGWSLQDESLHAQTGILISNIHRRERGYSWTDIEKKDLTQSMETLILNELAFLNSAFGEFPSLDGIITLEEATSYLYLRATEMLEAHELESPYPKVKTDLSEFMTMLQNSTHNDFFAGKNSDSYTTSVNIDWSVVKLS